MSDIGVLVWDERQPRQQEAYDNFLGIGEAHRGGIFFDLGGHMLDQVVWILGRPVKVTSFLRNDSGAVPAANLRVGAGGLPGHHRGQAAPGSAPGT